MTTVLYRGREMMVKSTGNDREPYQLVGKRGSCFTLVRHPRLDVLYVRDSKGKYNKGLFRERDGLRWIPAWGQYATMANR